MKKLKSVILFTFIYLSSLLSFSLYSQSTDVMEYSMTWYADDSVPGSMFIKRYGIPSTVHPALHLFQDVRSYARKRIVSARIVPIQTEMVEVNEKIKSVILNKEFLISADISEIRGQVNLITTVNPVRITSDQKVERLLRYRVEVTTENLVTPNLRNPESTFTSVLSSGDIYKISVEKSGVYKIDRTFLEMKLGIDVSKINPKKIKVYGTRGGRVPEANNVDRTDDLAELNIFVSGENDGNFDAGDYVLFYAEGADVWKYSESGNSFVFDKNIYDNNNYLYLKIDNQDGMRVRKSTNVSEQPEIQLSYYDMLQRLEDDKYNLLGTFTGTEGTGKDWYGDFFNGSTREKVYTSRFDFSNFNPLVPVEVDMIFAGRSRVTSNVTLSIGSKNISKSISNVNVLNAESLYARKSAIKESFLISDVNPVVKVSYPAVSADSEGWLDYLQIVFNRELTLNSSQMSFRNRAAKNASVVGFNFKNYSNQVVWNITNPFEPVEVPVVGNKITFKPNGQVTEFISHNNLSGAFEPVALGKIPNQNLHAMNNEQLIIVYHPAFKSEALRLADHRRQVTGMKVIAAETNEVYNEFSGGKADPGAIRDMAKLLLQRNPEFRYLLLFGDGSYDYKGLVKEIPAENFVPVYETDESLDPIDGFPSDDFYGLLGPDEGVNLVGGLDIYVGRLPCKTLDEAKIFVDKIIHYEVSPEVYGDWRLKAGYVADDEDGNTHLRDMDEIARSDENRHPLYNQQKVYADAFTQVSTPGENRYPEANKSIKDNIFKGQLTLTYLGHGGPLGWAQERILTVPEIQAWTNINSLTVMVTATCSFAAYDDPSVVSPAEYAMLNPKGGAIALMSTTRAVYTNSNKLLTDGVHDLMYKKINGKAPTLGYILAEGKNKYQGEFFRVNSRKFALLGDPSLAIAMPKHNIYTSKVNGKDATSVTDTINALEKVTIEGFVGNENGDIISGFNGTIYPTIYDKRSTLQTLSNDSGSPKFTYTMYKNIIFKGAATVKDGRWSFSFWVPKNINYTYGNGKISYYATDGQSTDAGGVFSNFIIGGTSRQLVSDDQGPQMDIFMNNESFVSGGMTNADPVLLLQLSDDFGINVTGNAVGQDITAILDGDNQNIYILNDFYEAQKDDFTKGKVRFPLNNLEKGSHFLVAKAWDISGNSTERRVDFLVAEDKDAKLKHVLNYPNPFTTSTIFQFEHDLANTELEIVVNIYTITGKLIKSIGQTKYSSGFRVNDIGWNGRDDFESGLARGIYLYKIRVHSKELNLTRESGYEKLIKL
ncbi:MAG: type IX secretion system sortase PorU [Saprospiraceae bacterium]